MAIEWAHPEFFLLVIIIIAVLLLPRRHRWFLRVSTIKFFAETSANYQGRINFKKYLPYLFLASGLLLLLVAAADPIIGEQKLNQRFLVHDYLLINDGSGSMSNDARGHPRGVGERISVLLSANEAFLEAVKSTPRPSNEKDAVGAIIFSSDAFILSYPNVNYDNLWLKLNTIYWKNNPLGLGTELNKALWVAVQAIIRKNHQQGGDYFTIEEIESLRRHVSMPGRNLNISPNLRKKIELIAQEIIGTSFIIFTDGEFNLEPRSYNNSYNSELSVAKNLLLCKELGIRVYLISAEARNKDVIPLVKTTGGEFYYLRKMRDVAQLKELYLNILRRQSKEVVVEGQTVKVSLYFWPGFIGFCLIYFGLLAKYTISSSLTSSY